jgi:hypothetical protein
VAQSKFSHDFAVKQLHVHRHHPNEIDQSVWGNKCSAAQSKFSHFFAVEQLQVHRHRLFKKLGNKCYVMQSKFSHVSAVEQLPVHRHRLNETDQPVRDVMQCHHPDEIDQSVGEINVKRHRSNSVTSLLWNSCTCTVIA